MKYGIEQSAFLLTPDKVKYSIYALIQGIRRFVEPLFGVPLWTEFLNPVFHTGLFMLNPLSGVWFSKSCETFSDPSKNKEFS
jgi:hypothetical protein